VPARLIGDRTYLPARFISQAMGARVSWDATRRAVVVETGKAPDYQFTGITIPSLTAGQIISGPVPLQAAGATGTTLQFYLINPATGNGTIVAAGTDTQAAYTYTPDPTVFGTRLVVAAVRGTDGTMRYSDPVAVTMAPQPTVQITGIDEGGLVDGPIPIGHSVNFPGVSTAIQVLDAMGNAETLGTVGPGDKLTWYPQIGHNGDRWLKAVTTDRYGNSYASAPVQVRVQTDYRTVLSGAAEGSVLTGPVTLKPASNYPMDSIKYVLDDMVLGWGTSYAWNITSALNGPHTLRIDVMDKDGNWHSAGPYNVTVNVQPYVRFSGIGPNQVVTGATTVKLSSNVTLTNVDYYLADAAGDAPQVIGHGQSFAWTPTAAQAGDQTIWAVATDSTGKTWVTDTVKFRVYLGKVYGKVAVATKDEFKTFAKKASVDIYRETGMSAALQTAQSFLETGYGQAVPVDKYTGKVSYNLFGIKGTGPAGSVIANTWEEYNGVSYSVDDNFRAYNNLTESWRDHAGFLLWDSTPARFARYAPFRAVMSDPVQGAWALRRTGYATDSQYPVKLINIMNANGLWSLDEFPF
jgi:hypothetical protein